MKTLQARTLSLAGSSYEIGQRLGKITASVPPLLAVHTSGSPDFDAAGLRNAIALFDRWCPGLAEELAGFADAVHAAPERIAYYAMTYLRPNCSHIALLPKLTESGHPLIARNYEFCDSMEDFTLMKTCVTGKYTHIGTSVMNFGRDDGFNECGLSVTMSSCGFPVGASEYMRRPALTGLQFWAVVRSVLENCRDVDDALAYLKDMPIAYNINLILADKSGVAANVETLDGRMAVKRIDSSSDGQYLSATNHPLLDGLISLEPKAMRHSLHRFELIRKFTEHRQNVTPGELKKLLLTHYPDGLCCHYYQEFFGTTKSMIIDPKAGIMELCWGGRSENGWRRYSMDAPFEDTVQAIELHMETADPSIFEFLPLAADR